ncbi:alpha/beta fold hydrolase [Halobacillus karajensis]|uniref:4,5:9,10-diseco-3-hydroxy-5,9, 17-trioxoandrosta-1(10),2-diene-4-oate hydrolase n=1 Tax=Halobacillus karajensis TaxID=195088 RepID=A0A059NZ69_9BACI|nr:alpha/beta fold hydrolase [Halobacillus karajensis]CDQ21145.1 4,5:9,10-diseco-3-hydroxy-5,9, 17-trioxoandrosta-1(10),2-diene-4-oate hydrolase [Halobacillus karajensis]CDQ24791.1 4,5:9,10-diseco-3-hydroxy-5,9, 17-trioxoandrosta-1(10),2-diene-4-oate hydrolase [Halobacillus karajensis]CDQ28849.1 4,5:9,10-diseco-3-hydroxy-5,9, 17-trioxoandrosta-1(10),2-diene-4-oate hydrolase [Halobacillus karajensis]
MTTTLLDTSKGIVEFTYKGSGPPVLLLRGGHSTRNTDLSHSSLIYEGFSLLTISRPGYDYTELSTGRTPEDFADTIIEVLDHLDIGKVQVISISAAGPTGIALAANHPSRVKRLLLEAALVTPWDNATKRKAALLFGPAEKMVWRSLRTLLKFFPDLAIKPLVAELTTENAEDYLDSLTPNDRRFIMDMLATSQSGKGFITDLAHDIPDMSRVKVPVLGMYSTKDRSIPYSNALLLKSSLPDCEIYEVNADSHLIWIGKDAHTVWNKRLEFLDQT